MSNKFSILAGALVFALVLGVAMPAYGQAEAYQVNASSDPGAKGLAIEPLDATPMQCNNGNNGPALLGAGIIVMQFQIRDIDPQADDNSDLQIKSFTVENLGTATADDIAQVMILDSAQKCLADPDFLVGPLQPVAPTNVPDSNVSFLAEFGPTPEDSTIFTIPDDGSETFFVAVRTEDTNILNDNSQRHTVRLEVTTQIAEEDIGSPLTDATFQPSVTDSQPEFIWNGGLNDYFDSTSVINPIMPGDTGKVSHLTLCDNDSNESNLVVTNLNFKQGPDGTALHYDIAHIAVFRNDGTGLTPIGTINPTDKFNRGGRGEDLPVTIFIPDGPVSNGRSSCVDLVIEAKVAPQAYKTKTIQIETTVSTSEPSENPLDVSIDPKIITQEPTAIGKGFIQVPDTVLIGSEGTVPVEVHGMPLPGFGAAQVGPNGLLSYDPSVVQVKSITGAAPYEVLSTQIDNRAGEARFTVQLQGGQEDDAFQSGTVANIEVEIVGDPGDRTRLKLDVDDVKDADNTPITGDVGVLSGTLEVLHPGDVNGDGAVTVNDSLLLAQQLVASDPCGGLTDQQRRIADVAGNIGTGPTDSGDKAPLTNVPTCSDDEADSAGSPPAKYVADNVVDLTSDDVAEIARLALGSDASAASAAAAPETEPVQALSVSQIQASLEGGTLGITAQGQGITGIQLDMYNLAGSHVLHQASNGQSLRARLQTATGQPLANGVYLYTVTVEGANGQVVRSEVRKLVVLR